MKSIKKHKKLLEVSQKGENKMSNWLYGLVIDMPAVWAWILFLVFVAVGFVLLVKGADVFVASASDIAKLAKIPTIVVGLTIVAFGTSMPEASVSITATVSGSAGISIGNIVGSNIFNLFFILGLTAVLKPVFIDRLVVRRDISVMLLSSYMLVLAGFLFASNGSRALVWFEGLAMLVVFVVYLVCMIKFEMKAQPKPMEQNSVQAELSAPAKKISLPVTILMLVLSLIAIVLGGTLVNVGAKGMAVKVGVSETLAGLTICAVGTSLPELVTSIVAMKKNEADIAIGNVIGSNIFNVMFILGLCSVISPLTVDLFAILDIVIMAVLFTLFFVYCLQKNNLGKVAGAVMISAYVLYLVFIVAREYLLVV